MLAGSERPKKFTIYNRRSSGNFLRPPLNIGQRRKQRRIRINFSRGKPHPLAAGLIMTSERTKANKGGFAYRPDIDGLRAVAVIAVMLYHAFPGIFRGGFCGVDVFFVISGFLITGLILADIDVGQFSLGNFYARRIRRIFPALAVVLILCLLGGHRMLLPEEFHLLGQHVVASVGFFENVLLERTVGYFATAAEKLPLLHLWSLAVEEQFYLVFPLVVLTAVRLRWRLSWFLGAVLLLSFAANVWISHRNPNAVFYLAWYRVWELLAGSLLALLWRGGKLPANKPTANVLSVCGAIGLAVSLAWLNPSMVYPSWRAAVPVASTVLLIAAGPDTWFNRRLLSIKVLVGIGLVSYPLYLFHWPLLSFLHIRDGDVFYHSSGGRIAALMTATVLAVLTYAFIERPIRRTRGWRMVAMLCLVMAGIGLCGELIRRGLVPNGNDSPGVLRVTTALADKTFASLPKGISTEPNVWRVGGTGRTTLFCGDSMALQHLPRLIRLLENSPESGRGAMVLADGGMAPIPGFRNPIVNKNGGVLETRLQRAIDEDASIDRVVLLGNWLAYFGPNSLCSVDGQSVAQEPGRRAAAAALEKLMRSLVARGKHVTLVLGFPQHSRLDPMTFLHRGLDGVGAVTPPTVLRQDVLSERASGCEWLLEIAEIAKGLGVEVIDPMDFLCPDGICLVENNDGPIRHDSNHLRANYVREHLTFLDHLLAP
ncbi:MAG: acyltransferase [Chthoniobacterales bacterium]|nr:acyltransferase [Chthoniobacterales bacterium]